MLGRAREAVRVESLVGDARAGKSGSLLISGEPGIGKTVLLAHARAAADAEAALVLEASGAEGEAHLAFAGLYDLLGPVLGGLDALPEPQADALRGALALGPPQPGDRFTTYAATLSLLAAAAEERPVACIIDDAHWLDAESFEAIQFASRRLGAEGVAVLLAARDGLSARVDASPIVRVTLGGLGNADAAALVRENAPVAPTPRVLEALLAEAKGNPLALIELGGTLTSDQLTGADPLPDPLPVGPYLQDALLRPIRALPEATRRALLVLSADDGSAGLLPAALEAEGLEAADLVRAEGAGVITIGPTRTAFSHPLVRAAVYQTADAADRRSAHRANAAAAVGENALDRRAWHLALATMGPDEAVATELEAAGARSGARNGHAAASEALEAAARLTPDAADRGRRLLAAGHSALAAGSIASAAALLDEVVALGAEPGQVIEAMTGRGFAELFGGSSSRATDMLVVIADRLQEAAPAPAALLLAQATLGCQMVGDMRRATELTERAATLATGSPPEVGSIVAVARAAAVTFAGGPAEMPPELEAVLMRRVAEGDPNAHLWALSISHIRMLEERYEEAVGAADGFVRRARALSTPSALPLGLGSHSELLARLGRFAEARALASEAVQIADQTGQGAFGGFALTVLARVEAFMGLSDDCRRHADAVLQSIEASKSEGLHMFRDAALGILALGTGQLDDALSHLSAVDRRSRAGQVLHPLYTVSSWDLAETLIRLGQPADAGERLAELEGQAEATGTTWPAAGAARCRGLMASDDAFEEHFARALALHDRIPMPFERGRTLLCLGERRRRARRVREAREALDEALDVFEALGAAPWAERARRELRASGARLRTPRRAAAGELTPQELQVALAVSEGATNKEVATALLISPKTVEHHLGHIYSKLGVHTRAELAARMLRRDEAFA